MLTQPVFFAIINSSLSPGQSPSLHWRVSVPWPGHEEPWPPGEEQERVLVAEPAPQVLLQPDQGDHWVHTGYKDIVDLGGT